MELSSTSFRVGAFVLGGAACLIALFLFLSGGAFNGGTIYETYFRESVQGLSIGSPVKYKGVQIGAVTDLALATAEYGPQTGIQQGSGVDVSDYRKVVVRYRLDLSKAGRNIDINHAIKTGLRAQLTPQGITGLSYINLSFVDPTANPYEPPPWKPNYTVIPSIPSTLTQVQDAVEKLMGSVGNVNLGQISQNLNELLATLNQQMSRGDGRKALQNAQTLLANLNTVLEQSNLPGTTASIRNLAGGEQTTQILTQLNQTTAQLAKVSAQLPALVAASQATIEQANETTADVQTQLGPILQSMNATMNNLRDLSASLSANPGQVILGAPPPPPAQPQGSQ